MSATWIILLILFVIGLALSVYYAVLCMQIHHKKPKQYTAGDLGPLLAVETPDLNGNNDPELPVPVETVRSIDEPDNKNLNNDSLDDLSEKDQLEAHLLKNVSYQTTPQCASKDPKADSVFLPIEDEPSSSNTSKPVFMPVRRDLKPTFLSMNSDSSVRPKNLPPQHVRPDTLSNCYDEDGLLVSRNQTLVEAAAAVVPAALLLEEHLVTNHQQSVNKPTPKKHVQFNTTPEDGTAIDELSPVDEKTCSIAMEKTITEQEKPVFRLQNTPKELTHEDHPKCNDISHPTNETPYATNETPSPTNETPSPTNETPSPTNETPSPTNESPPSTNETSYPTNETPYPANTTPYPANTTPYPANTTPYPANTTPYPVNITPYPTVVVNYQEKSNSSSPNIVMNPIYERMTEAQGPIGWTAPAPPTHQPHEEDENDLNKSSNSVNKDSSENKLTSVVVSFPTEDAASASDEGDTPDLSENEDTSSSDPEVTEYSFQMGPMVPSTAVVLADEMGSYSDPKVTSFVSLPEENALNGDRPPTPSTEGSTSSESSLEDQTIDADDYTDGKDILGTPPNTPPCEEIPSDFIISNPIASEDSPRDKDSRPVVVNTRQRSGSSSSSMSSSSNSSTSSSSTNGSYRIQNVDKIENSNEKIVNSKNASKIPKLK